MTHYDTLDAALQDIAKRTFYEDATVTPVNGGYDVDDDYATVFRDDALPYDVTGVGWPKRADDHSRLHEDYEFYDTAYHIRYNLSTAVSALEDGQPVTFAYAIVDAASCDEDDCPESAQYECECDCTVGWALLAAIHDN